MSGMKVADAAAPLASRNLLSNRRRTMGTAGESCPPKIGKIVSNKMLPKPQRKRALGDAGKQVFKYDVEMGQACTSFLDDVEAGSRRACFRPKLWWLLVGSFSVVVLVLFSSLFAVWYWSVRRAMRELSAEASNALDLYAKVTDQSVGNLTLQIDLRDMESAMLAVTGYLDMPFLAVEMLGNAMSPEKGYLQVGKPQANADYLWSLYRTLPALQSESSSSLQPRIEGLFHADRTGAYVSYTNRCSHPESPTCLAEAGKRAYSFGFDYRPGDAEVFDAAHCTFKCPPHSNLTAGYINFYTVDPMNGDPTIWFGNKLYDPRDRPWYQSAAQAKGIAAWSSVYADLLYEDGGHPDVGFAVTKAHFVDSEVDMVVGATLTLRHMSNILRQYEKAPDSNCLFIVERATGKMVANSDGFEHVVCKREGCGLNTQLSWTESDHVLTKRAMLAILAKFANLSNITSRGTVSSQDNADEAYTYSWVRVIHGNGAFSLDWLLVHVQPKDFYKGEIGAELDRRRAFLYDTVSAADGKLTNSMALTTGICFALVLAGSIVLAWISRLVTSPLKSIVKDMEAVATLDLDKLDTLLRAEGASLGWECKIREVALIRETFANMTKGLRSFSRYMDPNLVQVVIQSRHQAQLGVAKAQATIFFSDVADFTSIAESIAPHQMMEFLGEYLEAMSVIIMKHHGVVGEFIGDAIMGWWGVPWELEGCHTAAALVAALEQQQKLSELRKRWCAKNLPEIHVRMGLTRGQVLAGNIGSRNRMKYGLVGDSVNLASRLESLCKRYQVQILIDDRAQQAPGVVQGFYTRPVDLVTVKGRSESTALYELVACRSQVAGTPLEDTYARFCDDFATAHKLYQEKDFTGALAVLETYQRMWPKDVPAQMLRERCAQNLACPPGEGWSPVENLYEK